MKTIQAVNDFVIKFANVNGSGSASANELFAKAVMRMGVPVSPRNIFPSNIQGLPTWYEARICENGYTGRRGGVDMMVAMNPQTWEADVAEIESGGYLFYDSTRPMPPSRLRDDVQVIGVPLTEIANAAYADARERRPRAGRVLGPRRAAARGEHRGGHGGVQGAGERRAGVKQTSGEGRSWALGRARWHEPL